MSLNIYGRGAYGVFVHSLSDSFHADRENFHPDDIPVPWEFLPAYEQDAWGKVARPRGADQVKASGVDCGGDEKSTNTVRT